jgi:hypothetical protein
MGADMAIGGSSDAEVRAFCGKWSQVAVALGGVVAGLHGVPVAGSVVDLIDSLIDAEVSEGNLLRAIKADTAALRSEHFKSGLNRLADAKNVGPGHAMWNTYLTSAEEHLSSARSLVRNAKEEMLVEFNLSMVFLMKGLRDEAERHLETAGVAAERALDEYLRTPSWDFLRWKDETADGGFPVIKDDRPGAQPKPKPAAASAKQGVKFVGVVATMYSFGVLAVPWVRYVAWQKERLIRECRDFVYLYNTNEHAASMLAGRSPSYRRLSIDPGSESLSRTYDIADPGRVKAPEGLRAWLS